MARSMRPLIFSSVEAVRVHPTVRPAFRHSASIVQTTITSMFEPESSNKRRLVSRSAEFRRFFEGVYPNFKFRGGWGKFFLIDNSMPSGLNSFLGMQIISPGEI